MFISGGGEIREIDEDLIYIGNVRGGAKRLILELTLHTEMKDAEKAMRTLVALHALRDSIKNEPFVIAHFILIGLDRLNVDALEWTLNGTEYSHEQLKGLDLILREITACNQVKKAFISERCYVNAAIEKPDRGLFNLGPFLTGCLKVLGFMEKEHLVFLDRQKELIQILESDRAARSKKMALLDQKVKDLSFIHASIKAVFPAFVRAVEMDTIAYTKTTCGLIAIAVERYRLETGKLPDSLRVLADPYLEKMPVDPYDGRPFKYRRLKEGYVIYSSGKYLKGRVLDSEGNIVTEGETISFTVRR